jgi:hypothetical protein
MLEKTPMANECYKRFLHLELKRQEEVVLSLEANLRMARQNLEWLREEIEESKSES